jgi:outer membrane immunogenic protein
VGYAFDRTLLYVKGGVAGGGTKDNFTFSSLQMVPGSFIDFGTKNNLQVGGTIGAAVEHAFAPHWSAKIEYDYVDLGKNSENFTIFSNNTSLTVHEDINHRIQIVKVGANYRF